MILGRDPPKDHPSLSCSYKGFKGIELRRTATDDPPGKSPVLAASDALADPQKETTTFELDRILLMTLPRRMASKTIYLFFFPIASVPPDHNFCDRCNVGTPISSSTFIVLYDNNSNRINKNRDPHRDNDRPNPPEPDDQGAALSTSSTWSRSSTAVLRSAAART